MIDNPVTTIESSPIVSGAQSKHDWPPMWRRVALAVVMLVSIFMNFYQLGHSKVIPTSQWQSGSTSSTSSSFGGSEQLYEITSVS